MLGLYSLLSYGRLFGTDGVRGVLNRDMDPVMVLRIASSICTVLGPGSRVLVGRDVRLGGAIYEAAVVAGLLNSGCRPLLAGLTPTPALQFYLARRGGFEAGLMITASHNPPSYNGVKLIMADGIEAPREVEEEVEKTFFEDRHRRVSWAEAIYEASRVTDVNEFYIRSVVELVDGSPISRRRPTVLIDAANSVGALTLPEIARRLGAKPLVLNGNLDPYMSGRDPEPTPESLYEASRTVVSVGADIGVGVDGDADRSMFIDEKGVVHWGDRTALVLAGFLKERNPGLPPRVYTAVSSSAFIEPILMEMGIGVVWLKVGSPVISRALVREKGLLGFEENGGIMYPPHQPVRDSGAALALMLELLARSNARLSELYSVYPKTFTIKTKVSRSGVNLESALERISTTYTGYRQVAVDGLKVIMDDAWFLVRPSGTEPVVRIMVEALSEERARSIAEEIIRIIESNRKEASGG